MSSRGRLVVISGPSGSGKTTICRHLLEETDWERVVTCTTRDPRSGEASGRDYHFLSQEEFERGVESGRFLEHAEVFGNLYGTPRDAVERGIAAGKTLLLNIDVQGARLIRESGVDRLVTVFIEPPDLETLEARLRRRGSDADEEIRRRLAEARRELDEKRYYDHVVVNENLETAIGEVRARIDATRASDLDASDARPAG